MSSHVVVFMTASSPEEAEGVAKALVRARLVACCNIVPQIRSIYWWQGEVHDEPEVMIIAKTRAEAMPALIAQVRAVHSYEVPEIIALPIEAGNDAYLSWIDANVQPRSGG